ncbi:MAG: hypothetical protein HOH43_19315 [Candidatus Latescibacteria bacterium]|nr:hypothetical protein [Candidatus Latescibacterota bacterium]
MSMNYRSIYRYIAGQLPLLYAQKDKLWIAIWLAAISALWLWNRIFLNYPAFTQIQSAFLNTFLMAFLCIIFSLLLAWSTAVGLHFIPSTRAPYLLLPLTFVLNLIRSVPQILGVLIGYIGVTVLIRADMLSNRTTIIILLAFITALFVFLELVDLIRERIDHFRKLDFVNAMLCCGIKESRIINIEILWKNSLAHVLNKLIALFGVAIFLQCSVDFIVSIGLSTEVSPVNLPPTLGSMLAKIDSKQDILAIGYSLTHPTYVANLLFQHLQGITTAFLIVFTLLSMYRISIGFSRRHRL